MKAAKGEIVITLDDDVRGIKECQLEALCEKFSASKRLGV